MSENDPRFVCKKCGETNNLSDLREVSEEKKDHAHFECPECDGEKFDKAKDIRNPPEQTADQRREQKRQAKVRSLESQRFQR